MTFRSHFQIAWSGEKMACGGEKALTISYVKERLGL